MPKGIYKRKSRVRKPAGKSKKSGNKKVRISGSRILYGAKK